MKTYSMLGLLGVLVLSACGKVTSSSDRNDIDDGTGASSTGGEGGSEPSGTGGDGGASSMDCPDGTFDDDGDPDTECITVTLCSGDSWDDDGDPATSCIAKRSCEPGQVVTDAGSDSSDRTCGPCPEASFSTKQNALECTPWTPCDEGYVEDAPGSVTQDHTCKVGEWTRQFGSDKSEFILDIAADSKGNVIVAGYTGGTLSDQTSAGDYDAFLRKYDELGTELWTRQFGTTGADRINAVTIDASNNIFVAGNTTGTLPGQTSAGGMDGFIQKYDPAGQVLWALQFGTNRDDATKGIGLDSGGNIVVAGSTKGVLPGRILIGGQDALVRKYNAAGVELWNDQFGSAEDDEVTSLVIDPLDRVVLVGLTLGSLPDQVNAGFSDIFVREYDSDGGELWTRQFGSADSDGQRPACATDSAANVLVAGGTREPLPEQSVAGLFLRKYDSAGSALWTRQFGMTYEDELHSVVVDANGNAVVSGRAGEGGDAFVGAYGVTGAEIWRKQFGAEIFAYTDPAKANYFDSANAVCVDAGGSVFTAGITYGTLPGQPANPGYGYADVFVARLGL